VQDGDEKPKWLDKLLDGLSAKSLRGGGALAILLSCTRLYGNLPGDLEYYATDGLLGGSALAMLYMLYGMIKPR
jgi:hypothetical protein